MTNFQLVNLREKFLIFDRSPVSYNGDNQFANDVFTVAENGIYRIEIFSPPPFVNIVGCSTISGNLYVKINTEYTGNLSIVKELSSGDTITFYTSFTSTATSSCQGSADLTSTKVLIRKIF